MRRVLAFSGAAIVIAALGGCGQPNATADAGRPAGDASLPAAEVPTGGANAVAQRPEPAARTNFTTLCSGCHGTDPAGGRAPSLFNSALLNELSDEFIKETVLAGVPAAGMPPFAGVLDDTAVFQLIAYLRNEAADFAERPVFVASPDGQLIQSDKGAFRIEVLAGGMEVPWGMVFLPDGRMLVTERSGHLRIFDGEALLAHSVDGIPAVQVGQDAGLLDIILHPDYADNGWIYLSYVETLPGYVPPAQAPVESPRGRPEWPPSMTVIIRGRLSDRNEWVDSEELFRADPRYYTTSGAHFGSRFAFDDEKHLYFSIGERGAAEDAQDLSSPLGKIHRVNADGTVPPDNPFVGVDGAVPTIWSYGHRNPQGLDFDPSTGLLWESEHGPSGGDEINIIEPGRNYGWAVVSMGIERSITQTSAPGMEQPVVYYTPTIAPSGISFYEGDRFPGWHGSLLVAGLAGQQLRRLEVRGREVVAQEVLFDQFGRTRAVASGPDGLVYVLLQNPTGSGTGFRLSAPTPGMLIRLVPAG